MRRGSSLNNTRCSNVVYLCRHLPLQNLLQLAQQVTGRLMELGVQLVLVEGLVAGKVTECLAGHGISLVHNVRRSLLERLAACAGCEVGGWLGLQCVLVICTCVYLCKLVNMWNGWRREWDARWGGAMLLVAGSCGQVARLQRREWTSPFRTPGFTGVVRFIHALR
jgi:hypothetical protein